MSLKPWSLRAAGSPEPEAGACVAVCVAVAVGVLCALGLDFFFLAGLGVAFGFVSAVLVSSPPLVRAPARAIAAMISRTAMATGSSQREPEAPAPAARRA